MLMIVDADVLIFKIAAVRQEEVEWQSGLWTVHGDFIGARDAMLEYVASIKAALNATDVMYALTDNSANFRKKVYAQYKSTRVKTQRPVLIPPLRHELLTNHGAVILPTLEADDVIGLMATKPVLQAYPSVGCSRRIVCSTDKDFGCVPGKRYNWDKPELGVVDVSPFEARRFHMLQTLTGDTTDGYPGCKGVGPVKAEAVLKGLAEPVEMWEAVVAAYKKAGLGEETALQQARCAFILQHGSWTPKGGVKLWEPPTKEAE